MKKKFWGFLAAAVVPLMSIAAEQHFKTLTVGDDVYHNVTVTSVTPTDVYFTHSGGMGNAKLENLSPDLQQHFGFDPKQAATIEASRKQGAAVYSAYMQRERVLDQQRAEIARRQAAQAEAVARQRELQLAMSRAEAGKWVNQRAPEFVVETWLTPEPDRTGKFVLIDFWATWCGPCRESIPHLNALQQKFSNRLVIIGVSSEPESTVRQLADPPMHYASAIDTKRRMASQVGVTAIPHALLIDPSGVVRYQGHPALLKDNVVEAILEKFGS